ncbi:MAG: NAD(P)-dependent alcohol dehydrogenase, partial [Candidatus Sifarchaeia archaeon]
MKAAVVTKYGFPEGLQIRDVEKPTPNANEILVRIHATTVTFGDAFLRRMKFPVRLVFGLFMGGLGKNKILGHEFAG